MTIKDRIHAESNRLMALMGLSDHEGALNDAKDSLNAARQALAEGNIERARELIQLASEQIDCAEVGGSMSRKNSQETVSADTVEAEKDQEVKWTTNADMGKSFGGPTVFLESPDGRWGEYLLPEGQRIENGDKIRVEDCKFLGTWYEPFRIPKKENYATREEWRAAVDAHTKRLDEDDSIRLTFTGREFLTLIPVT